MRKVVIGQAGGPTAVINSSLVGFLENISAENEVYAVQDGYEGLVHEKYIKLEGKTLDWVKSRKNTTAACLGSGRYPFTEEKIEIAVSHLIKNGINTLVFIGGNGTMAALEKISQIAKAKGYLLQVIGIPKTVDNDLGQTDHAPGFGSAAKFVAYSTMDISLDLQSMKNFEQVRIIETMGRNAGWLALASGALRTNELQGPHAIYIPEKKFVVENFLQTVQEAVKEYGSTTIVISEGVEVDKGSQTYQTIVDGRTVLGGVSQYLQQIVKEHFGYNARAENLGMNQRCFSLAVSKKDQLEAYAVGKKAAELMKMGETNVMVSIEREDTKGYNCNLIGCKLKDVKDAGERILPSLFMEDTNKYYKWLSPLID